MEWRPVFDLLEPRAGSLKCHWGEKKTKRQQATKISFKLARIIPPLSFCHPSYMKDQNSFFFFKKNRKTKKNKYREVKRSRLRGEGRARRPSRTGVCRQEPGSCVSLLNLNGTETYSRRNQCPELGWETAAHCPERMWAGEVLSHWDRRGRRGMKGQNRLFLLLPSQSRCTSESLRWAGSEKIKITHRYEDVSGRLIRWLIRESVVICEK